MFKVVESKSKGFKFLELINKEGNSKAKISLNEGGRLQELVFDNTFLIKEQPKFKYKDSYASSILFPFASRIKEGKYSFNKKDYQLKCNQSGKNALHGLVYDKKFKLLEQEENSDNCSVTIYYQEKNKAKGFPYKYFMFLKYTFYENEIDLTVTIKNSDDKDFPFTLGWHPYFISDNLQKSTLKFKSNKKVEFDENLITKEIIDYKSEDIFKIENKQLDDCFFLLNNKVEFNTPSYNLEISSNSEENFLQMYTPKDLPIIAIEPMTGISNSFNNKIGLQVLEPNNSYSLTWKVKFNHN